MKTTGKMKDVKASGRGKRKLSEVIRKELGSEANRRSLTRMPAFRADGELPEMFLSLLGNIDRAERDRQTR